MVSGGWHNRVVTYFRDNRFVVWACIVACVLASMVAAAPLFLWALAVELALFVGACGAVWVGGGVRTEPAPSFPFLASAGGRAPPSFFLA